MPAPLTKQRPQITGFFSPRSPLEFLGFAFITCMLALVSAGNPIGFLFIPVFASGWWVWERHREQKQLAATSFSVAKEAPRPAKGLILLLSPFNPKLPNFQDPDRLALLLQQLIHNPASTLDDFAAINLLGSNLLPQIKAVEYHLKAGTLRDLWLITTESYDDEPQSNSRDPRSRVEGSEIAAQILEKYLYSIYGTERIEIHRNPTLRVKDYDYGGLWQATERIFQQASYKHEFIVADITGGTKMMSIAIAMACIPPGRRMQYMDAQRDWQGNPLPQGDIRPIMIDIDPMLHQVLPSLSREL